jgi:hypothetical protein
MECEQTDAILQWLATFDVESNDFLQDPKALLNCRILVQVYNQLSSEPLDINSLKVISSDTDWVNTLLNLRNLTSKLSAVLKPNKIEIPCDLSALARKKDAHELFMFLKSFLLFAVNSSQKSKALEAVNSISLSPQGRLKSILAEFAPKEEKPVDSGEDARRLESLQSELSALREKAAALSSSIAEKTTKIPRRPSQLEFQIVALKENHAKALSEQETLRKKLEKRTAKIAALKEELQELKNRETVKQTLDLDLDIPESVQTLELRVAALEKRIVTAVGAAPQGNDVDSFVAILELPQKRAEKESLEKSLENFKIEKAKRAAEAAALNQTLNSQNQRASTVMLKKIAQLNAEMDKSPLGEAKKLSLKYKRIIQKLSAEIEGLERSGGAIEIGSLQKEVQTMAARKAYESDLLAKKLSFMHSTAEQCDIRLQRIKLHVELQRHTTRLKRWKNSFGGKPPEKK